MISLIYLFPTATNILLAVCCQSGTTSCTEETKLRYYKGGQKKIPKIILKVQNRAILWVNPYSSYFFFFLNDELLP